MNGLPQDVGDKILIFRRDAREAYSSDGGEDDAERLEKSYAALILAISTAIDAAVREEREACAKDCDSKAQLFNAIADGIESDKGEDDEPIPTEGPDALPMKDRPYAITQSRAIADISRECANLIRYKGDQ